MLLNTPNFFDMWFMMGSLGYTVICETSFYEYPVADQSRLSLGKWLSANKGGVSLYNLAGPSAAISHVVKPKPLSLQSQSQHLFCEGQRAPMEEHLNLLESLPLLGAICIVQ